MTDRVVEPGILIITTLPATQRNSTEANNMHTRFEEWCGIGPERRFFYENKLIANRVWYLLLGRSWDGTRL
jgi:hypothetical protein